jgi:uncharacterized protein YcbK (DUF882 family)
MSVVLALFGSKEKEMSYFKSEEFKCKHCGKVIISAWLIHLLNKLREAFGKAIIINSGYRCKIHNKNEGGSDTSSHLKGVAVDIRCLDDRDRYKLVQLALQVGFKRIGVGKDFIHLDVDESKAQNVIWGY